MTVRTTIISSVNKAEIPDENTLLYDSVIDRIKASKQKMLQWIMQFG